MADIMAEAMTEHPDLSALTGSPGQKRKREPPSPDQHRVKRTAPAANMSATDFIENAIEATHAAAANGVNVADFNALQQAAAGGEHHPHEHHAADHQSTEHHIADHHAPEDHSGEQSVPEHHEATDPGNAASTAQAALGMYPTLHVPSSTEEQFAAQVAAEGEQNNHENSFNPDAAQSDGLMDDPAVGNTPMNSLPGQTPRYSISSATSNPKPSVGSEEWHKMRKDNHKEGR
jgi:transcriptional regulator CBF1